MSTFRFALFITTVRTGHICLTMLHQTGMQAVEEWGKSERETGTLETEEAQHV